MPDLMLEEYLFPAAADAGQDDFRADRRAKDIPFIAGDGDLHLAELGDAGEDRRQFRFNNLTDLIAAADGEATEQDQDKNNFFHKNLFS